jgi:hypothetical protein
MSNIFYLGVINRKKLKVYSWIEVPQDDIFKLYGNPDITKRALEKIEAQFEPPILIEQRIFRVTMLEHRKLSKAVINFGEKIKNLNYENFIVLSYKPPGNISRKTIKKGWEITKRQQFALDWMSSEW